MRNKTWLEPVGYPENMDVVIDPNLPDNKKRHLLCLVEKRGAVFPQKHQGLIEDVVINMVNNSIGAPIRKVTAATRSFLCI
jgi:hypothetical protein